MLTHTQPRQIPAGYVREGDEIATYTGTGMLAGGEKGVRDADWRDEIVWLDVVGYQCSADGPDGIKTVDGRLIPAEFGQHVVVRERVSVD